MKKNRKLKLVVIALAIMICFPFFSISFLSMNQISDIESSENNNEKKPFVAGYWVLSPIDIDGDATGVGAHNWTWVENQIWFGGGNGTQGNPYIIENITIDGQNSGNCIEIRDSNKYFIIRNCTLYNSGTAINLAGIKLIYAHNGTLINNNCSFNGGCGICLDNSNNTIISGNFANNNTWCGIYLQDSGENTISRNIASGNQYGAFGAGIFLNGTGSYSDNNIITGNTLTYNLNGIYLGWDSDGNIISKNYIHEIITFSYAIEVSGGCDNNIIKCNVLFDTDEEYINDSGTNTVITLNYYLTTRPYLFIEIINKSFTTMEFSVIVNISSQFPCLEVYISSITVWWDGTAVHSNNITDLGNHLYNISLIPKFVENGEDPILLNMTIRALNHKDKYYETEIAVEYCMARDLIHVIILEQSFTEIEFTIDFYIYDWQNQEIQSPTIYMWWNGTDVSSDVWDSGLGYYFVYLEPIFVEPGELPILLNMSISAPGYQTREYELYLAVDPEILEKGPEGTEFLFTMVVIIISVVGGAIVIGVALFLRKKRGPIDK